MNDERGAPGLDDLVELYALDTLPEDERLAFEAALADTSAGERTRLEARIASTREAANGLAEQFAAPVSPPARIRAAVLARVRAPETRARASRRGLWVVAGAVAACLALLAVAGWWRFASSRPQVQDQAMSREASMVMTASDARMAMGQIAGQQSMVSVTYSRSMDKGVVLIAPTARIPGDKAYQIWLVRPDHSMSSAGMLTAAEVGRPMVFEGVGTTTKVMLSLEPASGMPEPTGEMVSEIAL